MPREDGMRISMALGLALCVGWNPLPAGAQTLPDACTSTCAPDKIVVCSAANPGGCELKVAVQQSASSCTSEQRGKNSQGLEVAYCMVCVRRDPKGNAQAAPTVTWTLSPSAGTAAFRTDRGVLIETLSSPRAEFKDLSHSSELQKYAWKATLKNSSAAHPVTARVFGQDSSTCDSSTVQIVNTDQ
ncbi:MAG: hypothetical protein CFE45_05800 [Burkholderiales bacterium PBB5]|nr:MAG: hypothetical protein CFE45_05800 [Burkholderiales bacterium PBB5]